MSIINHFELHLGPIAQGWFAPRDERAIQVAKHANAPCESLCTYATLGLGHHLLAMPGGREVRQELLMISDDTVADEVVIKLLSATSDALLSEHRAVLRGEVIGDATATPIAPGSSCARLYAAIPAVFEESFQVYEESSPATVIVWLIPITLEESAFIRNCGWDCFESLLEKGQPDLFNWARASVV